MTTQADFIRTACAFLAVPGVSEREIAERKFALAMALWDERGRHERFFGLLGDSIEFCDMAVLRQGSTAVQLSWSANDIRLEAALRYDIATVMAKKLQEESILA